MAAAEIAVAASVLRSAVAVLFAAAAIVRQQVLGLCSDTTAAVAIESTGDCPIAAVSGAAELHVAEPHRSNMPLQTDVFRLDSTVVPAAARLDFVVRIAASATVSAAELSPNIRFDTFPETERREKTQSLLKCGIYLVRE